MIENCLFCQYQGSGELMVASETSNYSVRPWKVVYIRRAFRNILKVCDCVKKLNPIRTIPDLSFIRLLFMLVRLSRHTELDESDTLC